MANARGMKPTAVEVHKNYTMAAEYDGSNNPIYVGIADIGSGTDEAVWQIKKITYSGSNATNVQFAAGTDAFDKVWDSRAGYSYS